MLKKSQHPNVVRISTNSNILGNFAPENPSVDKSAGRSMPHVCPLFAKTPFHVFTM
jgi:hypothetical protein